MGMGVGCVEVGVELCEEGVGLGVCGDVCGVCCYVGLFIVCYRVFVDTLKVW